MQSKFIQLHMLTAYQPNVLNRDDANRPKTAFYGNHTRMRLASQCIKRAWRTSSEVAEVLKSLGGQGVRTREFWRSLAKEYLKKSFDEHQIVTHILPLWNAFEQPKKAVILKDLEEAHSKSKSKNKQLVDLLGETTFFFHAAEMALAQTLLAESLDPSGPTQGNPYDQGVVEKRLAEDLPVSGDVALFGRMVAGNFKLAVEGAIQVAHPFTVNKGVVEDDYFIAMDELNEDHAGAGHLSNNEFGSGLYYSYVAIDVQVLLKNLKGNKQSARELLAALVLAIATVSPSAKQNSFAARSYATYLMAELGDAQPRSFADSFLKVINNDDIARTAIDTLTADRQSMLKAFPRQVTDAVVLNRLTGDGTIEDIIAHVCAAIGE